MFLAWRTPHLLKFRWYYEVLEGWSTCAVWCRLAWLLVASRRIRRSCMEQVNNEIVDKLPRWLNWKKLAYTVFSFGISEAVRSPSMRIFLRLGRHQLSLIELTCVPSGAVNWGLHIRETNANVLKSSVPNSEHPYISSLDSIRHEKEVFAWQ